MKHTVRNYEIDINCEWTKDEMVSYAKHFLHMMMDKDRRRILSEHEIPNRTKMNKSFSQSKEIYDFTTRRYVPNPNYDPSLQYAAAEAWLEKAGFEDILLDSLRFRNEDIYSMIKRFAKHCEIYSPLRIYSIRKEDLHYGGAKVKEEQQIENELSDI